MSLPGIDRLNSLNIILASASPRRSELMSRMGIKFKVVPSTFPEQLNKASFTSSSAYVLATAEGKVNQVYESTSWKDDTLIIGMDTIVVSDDSILEKPRDVLDAVEILNALSGKTHHVLSAVVIRFKDHIRTFVESTEVTFGDLSPELINAYVSTGEPMDKAGAYGIQGLGMLLVKEIKGDYYNVVGFPSFRIYSELIDLIQ